MRLHNKIIQVPFELPPIDRIMPCERSGCIGEDTERSRLADRPIVAWGLVHTERGTARMRVRRANVERKLEERQAEETGTAGARFGAGKQLLVEIGLEPPIAVHAWLDLKNNRYEL